MAADLGTLAERAASLEARVEELARALHDHVERYEQHQQMLLKEITEVRQLLHTARTLGRLSIGLGGVVLALVAGVPALVQWLHDHVTLKP